MDDTIPSGENKLPLYVSGIAIAAALIALFLAIGARKETKATSEDFKAYRSTSDQVNADLAAKVNGVAKLSDVDGVRADVDKLKRDTEAAVVDIGNNFRKRDEILKSLVAGRTASHTTSTSSTAPVVAGPGEYIVKSGDTGYKIARANGVSVKALETVNPGVNFTKLKIGQKLKLPAKQ